MASIHDVAKAAGVSVATVSKVVNGYPDVSDKTRKKVNKIIEELRYHPNVMARGLVKKRSWNVGVLINVPFTNPFVSELLEGIKTALEHSGYDLMKLSTRLEDPSYSFYEHCRSRSLDGVVIFGAEPDNKGVSDLIDSDIPVMFVDEDVIGQRTGSIMTDSRMALQMVVRHLYELGHRRIAYIAGSQGTAVAHLRKQGYVEGLQACGLACLDEYIEECDYTFDGGRQSASKLITIAHPPTALVCVSDMAAFGAIHELMSRGLSVPTDISVVGFDNTYYAQVFRPGLTTVNQNIHNIGIRCIEHLIRMIEQPDARPPAALEPPDLVIRETTAAPAHLLG